MRPHFYIARFTLTLKSALTLHSGSSDFDTDNAITRDANGLPCIPGTSIAGVLSHLFIDRYPGPDGKTTHHRIFGFKAISEEQKESASATELPNSPDHQTSSNLQVETAVVQDASGKAAIGLQPLNQIRQDALLRELWRSQFQPFENDHVALTEFGTAVPGAKFKREYVPKGCSFSAEISYWADSAEQGDADWGKILNLFKHPLFTLGSATRAGYGRLHLDRLHWQRFDLSEAAGKENFSKLSSAIDDCRGLNPDDSGTETENSTCLKIHSQLQARHFWLVGGGQPLPQLPGLTDRDNKPMEADIQPRTEATWDPKAKRMIRMFCLPGSSIKGALRHRCLFHMNRYLGNWADSPPANGSSSTDADPLEPWFGSIRDNNEQGQTQGNAGVLYFDNIYVGIPEREDAEKSTGIQTHNLIDRFTGGVRNDKGQLFSERLLYKTDDMKLCIWVHQTATAHADSGTSGKPSPLQQRRTESAADFIKALNNSIHDLCTGALALGARSHGRFDATDLPPDLEYAELLAGPDEEAA